MRILSVTLAITALAYGAISGVSAAFAVDLAGGDILVLRAANNSGELVVVDPATAGQTQVTAVGAFINPVDIDLGPGGEILVADRNAQQVYSVDAGTGALTPLLASPFLVTAVTVTPAGRIFVARESGTPGQSGVLELDPDTGVTTDVSLGGFFGISRGMVFDGADLLVHSRQVTDDRLIRVDIVTGGQTIVAEAGGLADATGIALEADGNVVVVNQSNATDGFQKAVVRIDPATGDQTNVTPADSFVQPSDVGVAADGSLLVTANDTPFDLSRVDPVTGAITEVADGGFIAFVPTAVVGFGTGAQLLACDGFAAPFDVGPVSVLANGVLLTPVNLRDENGFEIGNTLLSPPVLEVDFDPGLPADPPTDVTAALLPAWLPLIIPLAWGNQFVFSASQQHWLQVLPVLQYVAPGTYTLSVRSGDTGEYVLDSSCEGIYVVE